MVLEAETGAKVQICFHGHYQETSDSRGELQMCLSCAFAQVLHAVKQGVKVNREPVTDSEGLSDFEAEAFNKERLANT